MDLTSLALPLLVAVFALGLLLIVKGGDAFVDAASWFAAKSGMPPFLIGATIVSLATTLPEVLVSIFATRAGSAPLAVGNAIGSVTANTGLILAVSLIALPSAAPRKNFAAKGALLLAAIFALFCATRSGVLAGWGQLVLWGIFAAFLAENILAARQCAAQPMGKNGGACTATSAQGTLLQNVVFFVLGAAGIAAGSQLLVASATALAGRLGVPQSVIAVTIVAVGTALPELVTAIAAIAKRQAGLSAGNILGANIIDVTLILPLCSLLNGAGIAISTQSVVYDIPVCLLCIALAVVPTIITQTFARWQGVALVAVYLGYLVVVV